MAQEFELFTTLRYDLRLLSYPWNMLEGSPSPYFLISYHYDRLLKAAQDFKWPSAVLSLTSKPRPIAYLTFLCQECVDRAGSPQQPLKIKITLSKDGVLRAQGIPTAPLEHDLLYPSTFNPDSPGSFQHPSIQLKVYLDTEPTPKSEYTSYKTTARGHYDAAKARLGITAEVPEDVLLYNLDGEVTEGSVRNVAFWREGRWVTPYLSSGCLAGTVRRWLLENGRATEGRIMRDDVREGEWVLVSNGAGGCLLGIISTR